MKNLLLRLNLLKDSSVIDEGTHTVMVKTINHLNDTYDMQLTEENGAMMVTHLSMAIMRVRKNEPVKQIDEAVYNEVKESDFFDKSLNIYESLEKNVFDVVLPEDEKKYMLVNLCLLLDK